jgi:hypothetical protein
MTAPRSRARRRLALDAAFSGLLAQIRCFGETVCGRHFSEQYCCGPAGLKLVPQVVQEIGRLSRP